MTVAYTTTRDVTLSRTGAWNIPGAVPGVTLVSPRLPHSGRLTIVGLLVVLFRNHEITSIWEDPYIMSKFSDVPGIIFATDSPTYFANVNDDITYIPIHGADHSWVRYVLGAPDEADAPQIWIVRVGSGLGQPISAPVHYHECHSWEILLSGSYLLDGEVRGPGSITFFPAFVPYGPIEYGSDGAVFLQVFSNSAKMDPIFETPPDDAVAQLLTNLAMPPQVKV